MRGEVALGGGLLSAASYPACSSLCECVQISSGHHRLHEEVIDLREGGVGSEPMEDIARLLQIPAGRGSVTALKQTSSETKQRVSLFGHIGERSPE